MLEYITNIKKGQAYNLFYCTYRNDPTSSTNFQVFNDINTSSVKLSVDGGSNWVDATNTPVKINTGNYKLSLTASEMNYDQILIRISQNYSGERDNDMLVVIDTQITTGQYSVALLNTMCNLINNGYSLKNQDFNNAGYNYYGLLKQGRGVDAWVIIREKTDLSEVKYSQKQGSYTYSQAWTNRTTLNYKDTYKVR